MASLLTPLKPENAHLDMDQKVPKTIRTSVYTPFLSGNAYIQGPHFKKRFPDLALGSHPRTILQFFNLFFQKAVAPTRLPFGLNIWMQTFLTDFLKSESSSVPSRIAKVRFISVETMSNIP